MKYSTASLQDLCLREVINNLEYYPPDHELLASLPPTLRRPLLVHMPIVDLCQLENTCVFDGVDAEMVWKERYKQQTLKYTSLIANRRNVRYCGLTRRHLCIVLDPERLLDRYKTMREKYFAAIIFSIFECARPIGYYRCDTNEAAPLGLSTFGDINLKRCGLLDHPVDIVNYLVAAVKINRVLVSRESSDNFYFTNPKQIHFDRPVAEFELLQRSMSIPSGPLQYLAYMATNELYQEVPPRYSSFLNEENHCRLSEEDALMLLMDKCDYYAGDLYINVIRCVAIRWNWEDDAIKSLIMQFSSKMLKLELHVCCYSQELRNTQAIQVAKHILEAIMSSSSHQLISLTISDVKGDPISTIAPLLSGPNVPRRIEELHLMNVDIASGANALGDILSYQSNISVFEVYQICDTDSSQFVTDVIKLLQRPNFKDLCLKFSTLSSSVLKSLVTTFLNTPCSQDQSVLLHGSITESSSELEQNLDIHQSSQEYKSLEIITYTMPSETTFNKWLLSLQYLKVKSLCITSFLRSHKTLGLASNNASLQLYLNLSNFSTEDFQTLLQNQSLKELQLVSNDSLRLCDITGGLVKIDETHTLNLETLSVNIGTQYRMFGSVESSKVEEFVEVLYSLPHQILNCFSLELSIGFQQYSDVSEFTEALFESWKKKPRFNLKRFILNFVSKSQSLQPLDKSSHSMIEEMGIEVNMNNQTERQRNFY